MVHVCVCIYDLITVSKYTSKNHMYIIDEVILFLKDTIIQVNAVKFKWYCDSFCCLQFMLRWDGR